MKGSQLAGTSLNRDRAPDDFYATPESSIQALLGVEEIIYPALEPACGQGHISKLLDSSKVVYSSDLVYRGYGEIKDFLKDEFPNDINTVITNPPFNLFQEFAEKALEVANKKVILFGKLQALEGEKRGSFMEYSPLRCVYVFKKRQNPMRNGSPVDEKGKPWASTMAFAWFVWDKDWTVCPVIKWL